MKILGIDTSSSNCTVAIAEIDESKKYLDNNFNLIIEKNADDLKTHSQKLMPMIDEAFKESNLTLNNIDAIVSSIGPGSFTGIRIGIATAKAFVDSKNIKAIACSSLESLAYNEYNNKKENTLYVSLIDAKNENTYFSMYTLNENVLEEKATMQCDDIRVILDIIKKDLANINEIVFIGDGAIHYKEIIENNLVLENTNITFSNNNVQSAASLIKAGFFKYINNEYGDTTILSPLYLRKSQAERMQDDKK